MMSHEYTLLKADIFVELNDTGTISDASIQKYIESMWASKFYRENQQYLANAIVDIIGSYLKTYRETYTQEEYNAKLEELVNLINMKITPVDTNFLKLYINMIMIENILMSPDDMLTEIETMNMISINNIIFIYTIKNKLLATYLSEPMTNIEKIRQLSAEIKAISEERNKIFVDVFKQ